MKTIEKLTKLIAENPDLPIKVKISGECYGDFQWYLGELKDCKVTELALYRPKCCDEQYYEKDDIDEIVDDIFDNICDEDYFENCYDEFSTEEMNEIAKQKAEELDWQKVILIYVGV